MCMEVHIQEDGGVSTAAPQHRNGKNQPHTKSLMNMKIMFVE